MTYFNEFGGVNSHRSLRRFPPVDGRQLFKQKNRGKTQNAHSTLSQKFDDVPEGEDSRNIPLILVVPAERRL